MFNKAAVDSARTARTVSEEIRMNSLLTVEREIAPTKALVDGDSVAALADRMAMHIESLVPRGRARCLELAGGDMTLAEAIQVRMARTDWRCIDIQPATAGLLSAGRVIPYGDREFDVALLCDVLHRAPEEAARLLAEAGRVAPCVLIKDRFEHPSHSRTIPPLAGFIGNRVPRDFTREAFARLVTEQRFVITAVDCDLTRTLRGTDWHFIAVLLSRLTPSRAGSAPCGPPPSLSARRR